MARLDRFKTAQDRPQGGFDDALREIRRGAKRGHWIWYIFPQLAGLGSSSTSQLYGLDGPQEAEAYLGDAVLRGRLLSMMEAVAGQLARPNAPALSDLMGSEIDALKLVSSLTLFSAIARRGDAADGLAEYRTIASLGEQILDTAAVQGYPRCEFTLRQLA